MLNLFQYPPDGKGLLSSRAMSRERIPCTYIMASAPNGTLYVGVTSDLMARIYQHRAGTVDGFTKRYAVNQLVLHAFFETMTDAIAREKQLKRWRREWKVNLIERDNPGWLDLAMALGFPPIASPSGPVDAETSSA
jgi:putative endonuclease